MILRWIAHSCFQFQFAEGDLLIDPFEGIGYEMPELMSDVVMVSHQHYDHNAVHKVKEYSLLLDEPGEYEYNGIKISAIESFHDEEKGALRGKNLIFNIKAEGLSITHLGDLGHIPTEEQYEKLKGTDVLLIPVGGNYTIDAEKAFEICKRVRPNMIIPMHYRTPGLKVDIDKALRFEETVKGYYDISNIQENSLEIKKDDLKHSTRVIFLTNRYSEV